MSTFEIVELASADTHSLRRSVLRVGVPATDVEFAEDNWPGVMHLGVRSDGELVAVSSWIPRPAPDDVTPAGMPAVQLRGMATRHERQGGGVGGLLLEAGCARLTEAGFTLVWARARDAALAFYERHGFAVHGSGFIDANTQLPHHLVARHLG